MYLRYSFSVVAPIARNWPRASAGFNMLEASMAPSAAPAPTSVCSSSMKSTICPSDSSISFKTALRRSSNSPRYFAPASMEPRTRATTRLFFRTSGTAPETIRCARPSTIAVLPTPGSPISTGLFFVRRERTWITRRISSSRPLTGSSVPCSAISVRSRPNRCRGLCSDSSPCPGCWGGTDPGVPSGVMARPPGAGSELRAYIGRTHDVGAATPVGHELGAEGAAHLLQALRQLDLGMQGLHLERLDAGVHVVDLGLEV